MNGIISSIATTPYSSTSKITSESVNSATETGEGQSTSTDTGVYSKYDTLELSQNYLSYKMQSESSTLSDETNLMNSATGEVMPPEPPPLPPEEMSSETAAIAQTVTEETTSTTSTDETTATSTDETTATEKPMGPPPPPPPMGESDDDDEAESDLLTILSESSDTTAATESSTVTDSEDSSVSNLSSYSESELKDMIYDGTISSAQYNAEIARRRAESETAGSTNELPPPERIPEKPVGEVTSTETTSGGSTLI